MQHLIKRSLCVFSILILTSLGLSAHAADPTSYPLLCKGGSGMKIEVTSQNLLSVTIKFRRGTKAATAGLEPGTCAWSDRGMSPNEPVELMLYPTSGTRLFSVYTPESGGFSASIAVEGRGSEPRTAAGLRQIINAVKSGSQFQVYAFSTRRNARMVLEATKYGP